MKLFGQILGIVVAIICLITPQLKRKWQILSSSILANLLSLLNFFLIGEVSAAAICAVAIVQCLIGINHANKQTKFSYVEIVAFAILYVFAGLLPFLTSNTLSLFGWKDLLPIIGALFFLAHILPKKEQNMRKFSLANSIVFITYDALVQSTQIFAQLITAISLVTALLRYRKKKGLEKPESNETV